MTLVAGIFRWFARIIAVVGLVLGVFWFFTMPGQEVRGLWRMHGGGQYLDIGMFRADVVTVSNAGCNVDMSFPANTYLLRKAEEVRLSVTNDVLELATSGIHPDYADRATALPASCDKVLDPDSAIDNFEMFWAAFDENYDFFDLYGVDWDARGAEARKTINDPNFGPDPDGTELRDVMTHAWRGLDDGHIVMVGDGWRRFPGVPQPYDKHWDDIIDVSLTNAEFTQIENAWIMTGWATPEIGIIYLDEMDLQSGWGDRRSEVAEHAMEAALANLHGAKGYIIDNRFNPGGSDEISLAFAGWFNPKPRLIFTKSTRDGDKRANPQSIMQPMVKGNVVTEPVVLLNSRYTESAAEIFTFAMRGLDHVTIMGQNSAGGLSDVRGMRMPNGWQLGLSNQSYLSPEGEQFEFVGIPPDIHSEIDVEGFLAGNDTLMQSAIAFIEAQ